MTVLRGYGAPPLYDVLSQSVEGKASKLWVLGSSLVLVLLFISIVQFYKCIFGENVMDLENFQYVLEIILKNLFTLVNISRCPIPP